MALEDIPQMLVHGRKENKSGMDYYNRDEPFDFSERPIAYSGTFITLSNDDASMIMLFSAHRASSHPSLRDSFYQLDLSKLGIDTIALEPTGGGVLAINDTEITLRGESTSFGKYQRSIVQPIVERWAREHLPLHTIKFE